MFLSYDLMEYVFMRERESIPILAHPISHFGVIPLWSHQQTALVLSPPFPSPFTPIDDQWGWNSNYVELGYGDGLSPLIPFVFSDHQNGQEEGMNASLSLLVSLRIDEVGRRLLSREIGNDHRPESFWIHRGISER